MISKFQWQHGQKQGVYRAGGEMVTCSSCSRGFGPSAWRPARHVKPADPEVVAAFDSRARPVWRAVGQALTWPPHDAIWPVQGTRQTDVMLR